MQDTLGRVEVTILMGGYFLKDGYVICAKIKEKKEVEKIETTTPGKSALLYDPGCFALNFASFCQTKILKQEQEQQQQQQEPSEPNRNGERCPKRGSFSEKPPALCLLSNGLQEALDRN